MEIFSRYLAMLVWPGPLDLQHGPEFLGLPGAGRVLAYAAVCLVYLAVLMLAIRRRWQIPAFCLLWVGITLLPACNLIPVPLPLGERSTYLASVGSCSLFGWALTRRRFLAPVALLLILPLYAYRLGARVPDWCDEVRLWNSSAVRHPDNYEPLRGLAANLLLQGSYREAEALYARMFPVVPDDPDNRMGLARSLMGQKRWGPAGALLAAIPPSPALGQCFFQLGRYRDALKVWSALPASPDVRLYTGLTWERLGDAERARAGVEGLDLPRAALLRARLGGTP